ncbi:hypothetical protein F511_46510 [Dorcoceras hygrometricum]|uniref:Uncharacterized protein n=1 Tax=Dorcoceras hygrometricum TaxID=472368 RepID=A0A2Z6ZTC7_9LAMI|nr:hypothetical protein F511_46510 [Dorcoceras hygrometricum]
MDFGSVTAIDNRRSVSSSTPLLIFIGFDCNDHIVGDPDPPPGRQRKNNQKLNREAINTKNKSTFYDIHRMFSELPLWHLCLAPTGVSRTRLFSVDCGRNANPVHDQI